LKTKKKFVATALYVCIWLNTATKRKFGAKLIDK